MPASGPAAAEDVTISRNEEAGTYELAVDGRVAGVAQAIAEIADAQGTDVETMTATVVATRPGLLEQFIDPRGIADLVAFLASPLSSATNGAAVRAEGGLLTSVL